MYPDHQLPYNHLKIPYRRLSSLFFALLWVQQTHSLIASWKKMHHLNMNHRRRRSRWKRQKQQLLRHRKEYLLHKSGMQYLFETICPYSRHVSPLPSVSPPLQSPSLSRATQELPTFKNATPEEAQVMAYILSQLRGGSAEGFSIRKLRESASHFATTHDIPVDKAVKTIYKLNSLKLLEVDRSRAETVVRLVNQ